MWQGFAHRIRRARIRVRHWPLLFPRCALRWLVDRAQYPGSLDQANPNSTHPLKLELGRRDDTRAFENIEVVRVAYNLEGQLV